MKKRVIGLNERMLNSIIPAQTFSAALMNINAFLNSIVTGALFSAESIAAISFIQPITMIISMIGGAIATGAQVTCGRYIGKGDSKGANRIFTLSAMWSLVLGAIMTCICIIFAEPIASLMGAKGNDLINCAQYLRGMSGSIIFVMFSTAMMSFMQLDGSPHMSMAAIAAMVVTTTAFDFINVKIFDMGIFGIGFAMTIGYAAMMIVGAGYYMSKKCNFRFSFSLSAVKESGRIFYIGLPGAASSISIAIRSYVLNNLCFSLAGTIGVSAVGIFYTMSGFVTSISNGIGGAAGILSSVFVGERNRTSILDLCSMANKKSIIRQYIAYVIVFFTAKPFALLLGTSAADLPFVVHAIRCSMTCILGNMIFITAFNIYKSLGNVWFGSVAAILDYCVFQCFWAWSLSGVIGINSVWFSSILSEICTYFVLMIYCRIKLGRFPAPLNNIYIPDSVSVPEEDRYDVTMRTIEDVEKVSAHAIELCKSKGIDSRRSFFCGLCIEEQCANIIYHGMTKGGDPSEYLMDLRMIFENGKVTFSLRDNCVKFDPTGYTPKGNEEDKLKGTGIGLMQKLPLKVSYRYTFGLNMLIFEI